ncbi:MAG: molybdopterin molybdotransferase MoeA [Thermoplasmataceae archaeon]
MSAEVRKKMGRFSNIVSMDEAFRMAREYRWKGLPVMEVETANSAGMIAARTILARRNSPTVPRSLVDGFAIKSGETEGSSAADPSRFRIAGKSEAGKGFDSAVSEGECVEIYTGGIIPEGADAVAMAESVTSSGDFILISSPVSEGENVAGAGEDIQAGTAIINSGSVIRPWHLPAMIDGGVSNLPVFSPLRVGILSTGDELFPDAGDHVENSGMTSLMKLFPDTIIKTFWLGQAHDDPEEIAGKIRESSGKWDILLITGGSSLGRKDEVPESMEISGSIKVFGGMRTKPGRTTSLYSLDGRPVISLSGFPSTSILIADLMVEVLLVTLTGIPDYRIRLRLPIDSDISTGSGYTRFIPGKLERRDGRTTVVPESGNRGMRLSSLLHSSGIIIIPDTVEGYRAGDFVEFRLW